MTANKDREMATNKEKRSMFNSKTLGRNPKMMKTRTFSLLTLAALFALAAANTSQAAILAVYDFDNYTTASNRASNVDPDDATASSFNAAAGTAYSSASDTLAGNDTNYTSQGLLGSFTVTADTGLTLNLTDFIFAYGAEQSLETGDEIQYAVEVNDNLVFTSAVITGDGTSQGFDSGLIDLSGATFQGLSSATVEILGLSISGNDSGGSEFRVFGSVSHTYGSQIDRTNPDMTLNGTVIPEPSSLALLGLVGMTLLTGRRRR